MAETSKEKEAELAGRKSVPHVREPQGLKTGTEEVPPAKKDDGAPAAGDELAGLKEQMAKNEARMAEILDSAKKKDSAIEELRRERDEARKTATKPAEDDDVPIEDRIARASEAAVKEAMKAALKDVEPLIASGRSAQERLDLEAAVKDHGQDVVNEHLAAANERRSQLPGLTLSDAIKLVRPAGAPATETAPPTPVAAPGKGPATPTQTDAEKRGAEYQRLLEEANEARRHGDRLKADRLMKDAAAVRIGLKPPGG